MDCLSFSSTKQTKAQSQRLPAPSLFVGPPSHNASNISLAPAPTPGPSSHRLPLDRQRSLLSDRPRIDVVESLPTLGAAALNSHLGRRQQQQAEADQHSNNRTDALWAEMQNTLEEVELSAINGTHVFGTSHSKALGELRNAQVALAQAWARSEGESNVAAEDSEAKEGQPKPLSSTTILSTDWAEKLGNNGKATSKAQNGKSKGERSERSQLEEETENDIILSRKRREANDRYFRRVNEGVLDVVSKLEEVARAMRGVEQESKEIWGDGGSLDEGSVT
ncbi:hypothetical protein B0A49_11696 [Cryomyces minteri]|uniref:Uncharacterized protein n=1 Tax=Cryomyces minteri TaxID=331657 RepID=A0A4U0W773_9PEZI|nr:hypothetical protein B0A49_11696 [Cryomyces minteri]